MLMSKRDFITINVSNENTQVQILKPEITDFLKLIIVFSGAFDEFPLCAINFIQLF